MDESGNQSERYYSSRGGGEMLADADSFRNPKRAVERKRVEERESTTSDGHKRRLIRNWVTGRWGEKRLLDCLATMRRTGPYIMAWLGKFLFLFYG